MTSLTISGIISGLDTSSIIDKLVAVEGNSQTLLKNQQTAQQSAVSAYSGMLASIGSLATQVGALAKTSSWATTTAVSSSSSVTATATGNQASSLTFNVTSVAAAHTLISDGTVTSTSAPIAGGSIAVTKNDGTTTNLSVGGGTLAEVVAAVNGSSLGLQATAIQTAPGAYRLQIAASSTGASSVFSVSGITAFSGTHLNILTAGSDAEISLGQDTTSSNPYTVKSSTNKFSNVTSGLSFTVSKVETGVTVSSTLDPSTVSDQISAIVTNTNNLLSSIAANTAYDPTSKKGGPLLGDSTVRSLQQSILSIVASVAAPGLSVTSTGQLSFDKAAFATAFTANPAAVASAFGASSSFTPAGSSTGSAVYTNSTSATAAGTYAVNVTSTAKSDQWQVTIPPGTGIVGRLISLQRGSTTVSYTAVTGDDGNSVAAKLNTKLAQAGFGANAAFVANVANDGSGNLVLTANQPGASSAFTAKIDNVLGANNVPGANIDGTIDGEAATGIGNILTLPSTASSDAAGLSIAVSASSTGTIGSITYQPGLAQKLDKLFSQMSDSATGQLVTAQAQATAQVKTLQDAIDSWTTRLDDYKKNLTRKFAAMESALASLKSQSSALTSFSGASSSNSSSRSSSS